MKKYTFFLPLVTLLFLNYSKPVAKQLRKNKDYALFFAVNHYQNKEITDLQNPINDAKQIAEELKNTYDFETEIMENPTYEIIDQKLEEYTSNFNLGNFDKEGQLFLFFSGHGKKQSSNGYFLPSNTNLDDLKRTAFAYKLWRDDIDAINCKHILIAIDACYSGTFDPKSENRMKGDSLWITRGGELSSGERLITEHQKHKTRLFFTSGGSEEQTPDKSDFFKKFLIALLSKGYNDNILTSSEIFANHLERISPKPQAGEFGSDESGSSFLFISNEFTSDEWIGMKTEFLDAEAFGFMTNFKMPAFRVSTLKNLSAASKAGLKEGDFIISFVDSKVQIKDEKSLRTWIREVNKLASGKMKVLRKEDGRFKTIEIVLLKE